MDLEIAKTLVLSTGHVTEQDMNLFKDPESYPYTNYETGYGVMIYLVTDIVIPVEQSVAFICDGHDTEKLLAFSRDFRRLLKLAQDNDCQWLHLDCDGNIYEELPQHEW